MNAADRRRLTPALGILAGLLALLLLALWFGLGRGAHWTGAGAAPALPTLAGAPPPPAVPALEQFDAVWQRPLFSPDRAPEAASGAADGSSGELELTGVVMGPGLNLAIVHDKTSGKDYRVVQGQPARGGPSLVTLRPRSAVVDAAGSRLQLGLTPGPAPEATAAAPAGSAPAEVPAAPVVQQGGTSETTAARVRELRKRIEARRLRNGQNGGG